MDSTLLEMIRLVTLEDAARLERQARELITAGHDPESLTIAWCPLSGEREVVPTRTLGKSLWSADPQRRQPVKLTLVA
jgi:hypothetical protein